ncbi:sodium/bile acid cotransporter 5-like [Styela clava]
MKRQITFLIFLATLNQVLSFESGFINAFGDTEDILIADTLDKIETFEDVKFNYTVTCNSSLKLIQIGKNGTNFVSKPRKIKVRVVINDTDVARMRSHKSSKVMILDCLNESREMVEVTAGHLGITKMTVEITIDNSKTEFAHIEIRVKRKLTLFDKLTFFILGPLILLNKCAFGAKIEVDTLKHIFTYPVALVLCLFMQFIAMPLLAVFYSTIFQLNQAMALALFVGATCPGGGGGYVISYLVGGDVTLAISASLLSTIVAMGAMPAVIGLYAYATHIPDSIEIPYIKMVLILCAIAVPISLGMVINRKKPQFAKKLIKIIQPLSLFLIFCGFLFLAVSSKYIIHGPHIGWALAVLLPSSGFILSIAVSRGFGQSWPFAKAISLESGMKNTVLGIAVIELSYPQPEADLSSILIIMVTLGHTTLAMLWYFSYLIKQKCCGTEERNAEFMKLESLDSEDDFEEEITELAALKG